jgi:nitroreductase/FMN reductase [NAD(P)H]
MPDITLSDCIAQRFGSTPDVPSDLQDNAALNGIAGRGSCRHFDGRVVPAQYLHTLSAVALAAPSKSDLQQRDILLVTDTKIAGRLREILGAQDWIAGAPSFVVFLANNRRQRQIHNLHGLPFANDHLDAFFNASVDAGIALAVFTVAAEAAGFGCCPISTIRNHLPQIRDLLNLPDHVFPVAGLAIGYPADPPPTISARLPLSKTVHENTFADIEDREITGYDDWRLRTHPAARVTPEQDWPPGWSLAKARQYNAPQRVDFAQFLMSIGFRLE